MPAKATPLPLRHDTLLGVCEGLGRMLHIHPNILRVTFSALLLWDPVIVIGTYLGLGVLLALVHWLVPDVTETVEQVEQDAPEEETRLAA